VDDTVLVLAYLIGRPRLGVEGAPVARTAAAP